LVANNTLYTNNGPVVVVGATGQQGRAVVSTLLAQGVSVRALVRDPSAARAQKLSQVGAELVTGDLTEPETLVDAFRGAAAVFAMTTFAGPQGPEGEIEQGEALADAIQAAGVKHAVYSSVGGAERNTGIPHFESKRRIEERFEALDLETTFIRPTFFMDNFASFSQPAMEGDTLVIRMPLPDGIPLQMVSVRDIGRASVAALLSPGSIPGGAVEIAGDELTGSEIANVFSKARGVPARYEAVELDTLPNEDQKKMFTWFTELPAYRADKQLTQQLVPDVQSLHAWIQEHTP
jgi:uncharacterized protein YbjT (DUF2867 family)